MARMEQKLYAATKDGKVDDVKEILRNPVSLNVNQGSSLGFTALHRASASGYDSIVPLLLAHPDIDVNQKENDGYTPFSGACANGRTSCVQLLLRDSRVNVNEPGNDGDTPLRNAASWGHLDTIKWWIASGREMELGKMGNYKTDAIAQGKEKGHTEVVTLLERFRSDAIKTRSEVRLELGITPGQSRFPFFFLILRVEAFSPFAMLDFPVITPPKLTRAQYEDYLDDKSFKKYFLDFLDGKPVTTMGNLRVPGSPPTLKSQLS